MSAHDSAKRVLEIRVMLLLRGARRASALAARGPAVSPLVATRAWSPLLPRTAMLCTASSSSSPTLEDSGPPLPDVIWKLRHIASEMPDAMLRAFSPENMCAHERVEPRRDGSMSPTS